MTTEPSPIASKQSPSTALAQPAKKRRRLHVVLWRERSLKGKLFTVFVTVLATVMVIMFGLNFATGEKHLKQEIPRIYSVGDPQFRRAMGVLLGPGMIEGNRVETLLNGDEIFPAMLLDIRAAQKTINFETYIYWSEPIGREFADALAERARAGVKVHVLVDWFGSNRIDSAFITTMTQAGVEFNKFHPLRWYNVARWNNRTHRKLLIVDGRIGYTGGVGIAGPWTGHAQDPQHWRDNHYRIEGPVVAQMQAVFMDNWIKAAGKVLHGDDYFPPLKSAGFDPTLQTAGIDPAQLSGKTVSAQMFSSSPAGGSQSMELMYLLAITAAEHNIQISNAYFIPDKLTEEALKDALQRGVKVQIITPGGNMDAGIVRSASRSRWGGLLQAGAEMYEYQPTMFHCKLMIVDELFVSLGSTNFDPRSFGLNDETNLNVFDADFARRQSDIFNDDLAKSRRVTFAQWNARPFTDKIWEEGASLLGPML
jgi:cardiolipin synthase